MIGHSTLQGGTSVSDDSRKCLEQQQIKDCVLLEVLLEIASILFLKQEQRKVLCKHAGSISSRNGDTALRQISLQFRPLPAEAGAESPLSIISYGPWHLWTRLKCQMHIIVPKLVFVLYHNTEGGRFLHCRFLKLLITNRVWAWHGFD